MAEHPANLEAFRFAAEKHQAEAASRRTKLWRERRKRAKANAKEAARG